MDLDEDSFSEMMDLYASDFDSSLLKSQLQILQTKFPNTPKPVLFSSFLEFFIALSQSCRIMRWFNQLYVIELLK